MIIRTYMPARAHRVYCWCLLTPFFAVASSALAQAPNRIQATPSQANDQPQYTLRTQAPLTIVDVVVTDSKGKFVHGLKQSDFTLFEDNKEMVPNSFEEHRADQAPTSGPTLIEAKQTVAPNSFTNIGPKPGPGPINVLLLDSLNTPLADQAIIRLQMLDYIKRMPPGTRMAIFGLTTRLVLMQGFTSDPEVLKATLTSSAKMMPQIAPLEDPNQEPADSPQTFEETGNKMAMRGQYTFDAVSQIARYLSGMPGRKNLIWFSSSFPTQFPPEPRNPEIYPLPEYPQIYDFGDDIKAMGDMLARSRITVFSIEPRGLDKSIMSRKGENEFGEHGTMDTIADLTGGKNFHNTNGLTEAVEEAVNSGSNFYTLTYAPTNQTLDTRFRAISVKVDQPGVHLTYRNGYYAVDPNTTVTGRKIVKATPMQTAMLRGALDATQIFFKVNVAQSPGTEVTLPISNKPDAKQMKPPYRHYSLAFLVDVNNIVFTPGPDGNYRGDFEFGVSVYNADGDEIVNTASKTVSPILPPAVYQSMRNGGANAHLDVDVPATGDYFLRIAVHDLTSDRIGAIEVPTASITPDKAPAVAAGR